MSTFKYYNIQILPLNENGKMIGSEGYQSVFKSLDILVSKTIESKSVSAISHSLRNDFFIAPIDVKVRDDCIWAVHEI